MSIWTWLLNPSGLTAHGFCLNWAPGLVGLHVGSDALIGASYLSIPLVLASFARQRRDLRYGWALYLFVAFIVACGATHLFSILTLWSPAYGVEGLIKAVTAILSVVTAAILWPLLPKLVALPSPTQLEEANAKLSTTVAELLDTSLLLKSSEAKIRTINLELERRVAEQTAELQTANQQLTSALEERRSIMQALVASEETFRTGFESAAVGKVHTDPKTALILRANKAFASMLGYEPEELVGRSGKDLIWPEDFADTQKEHQRLLAGEISAYVLEKRYLHRDGHPIWGRVSWSTARDIDSGEPTLSISVVENIEVEHRSRLALEAAKRELEAVVEERTMALAQRDILLREVYHRVKNNLQIIDSFLVMQARRLTDPAARDALLNLRRRVFALGLVHHQLMGSQNLRTFDVAPYLKELSGNILEGYSDRGITLSVEAAPMDVGLDFAIPLGLLVTELVTNSLKHAFPDGAGNISVSLQRGEDGEVALIVADDGQGQGQDGPESPRSTPGLGTSIIAGLVAQLRGTMTMGSEIGTRAEIRVASPVLS